MNNKKDKLNQIMEVYDVDYMAFVEKSWYYKSIIHQKHCKICSLPVKIKQKINQMLLSNNDIGIIETFLVEQYPEFFDDVKNIQLKIKQHKQYLPYIIEDVAIKSIFKKAKSILDNKDVDMLDAKEHAQLISDIEAKLIEEYSDIEDSQLSLLNNLFKETLPMILSRLQETIVQGKAKEIKDITEAANVMWKMTTAMAASINKIDEQPENDEVDFSTLDNENGDTRKKIVSLADKIKEATGG